MPRCPHSSSLYTYKSMFGNWRAGCELCALIGPVASSEDSAKSYFWREHFRTTNQEKTMPTYEDGYRKGVEDATHPLYDVDPSRVVCVNSASADKIIADRRKSLLIKKVTKWVIVLNPPPRGEEYIGQGRLWDSQSAAQRFSELHYGDTTLGIFSIEIEIPL